MAYGLFREGRGGTIRKIKSRIGKPRTKRTKKLIVWHPQKKEILKWIKKWGTKSQKRKHLK